MVKTCTNEYEYFKDLKNFLTYHFNKTPGNETKLANVLEYCRSNWKSIGEEEVVDIEDENIKTLLELRPIDLVHYFEFLAYGTENVMAGAKPTGYRSNSLLAYKRSISYYMPLRNDFDISMDLVVTNQHVYFQWQNVMYHLLSFDIIGARNFGTQ